MWRRFCTRRALARIERKIDIIMSQIADLKPVLDGIGADVTALGTSAATVIEALAALQASVGNPATASVLTPADQALLDAAVGEAGTLKTALDGVATTLQTAAATTSAPAPAPAADTSPTT